MRARPIAITLPLLGLSDGPAHGEPVAGAFPDARPKVYGLVAAVGAKFSLVSEGPTTGTHLSPYRRTTTDMPNDILNRMALHSLDDFSAWSQCR